MISLTRYLANIHLANSKYVRGYNNKVNRMGQFLTHCKMPVAVVNGHSSLKVHQELAQNISFQISMYMNTITSIHTIYIMEFIVIVLLFPVPTYFLNIYSVNC